MVRLASSSRLCLRHPTRNASSTPRSWYSTGTSPDQPRPQPPLSRAARARVEGVAAVQNIRSSRDSTGNSNSSNPGYRSIRLGQASQGSNNSNNNNPPNFVRRVEYGQPASNASSSSVLDLRNMGASSRGPRAGGPRPFNNRFPSDPRASGRPPGAGRGGFGGRGRGGAGRGGMRGGRGGRGGAPLRRSRQREGKESDEAKEAEEMPMSEREKAYEAEKERLASAPKPAAIEDPSAENMLNYGPRTVFGSSFGAAAALHGALTAATETDPSRTPASRVDGLATDLLDGKYVYALSAEEEQGAVARASARERRRRARAEEKKPEFAQLQDENERKEYMQKLLDEAVPQAELERLSEAERREVMGFLLRGEHRPLVEPAMKGLAGEIVRQVRRNETYYRDDEAGLLRKLQPMLPVPRAQARARETGEARVAR